MKKLLLLGILFMIGCCRIYIRPDWPEYRPYPKKEKVRVDTVYIEKKYQWDDEIDKGIFPEVDMRPTKGNVKVIEKDMPYLKSKGRVIEKDMGGVK